MSYGDVAAELAAVLPQLRPLQRSVVAGIAARRGDDGWTRCTQHVLMQDTGIRHQATLSRTVRQLERTRVCSGRLLYVHRAPAGAFRRNAYLLFPDRIPVAPEAVQLQAVLARQGIALDLERCAIVLRLRDEGIDSLRLRVQLAMGHDPEQIALQIRWIDRRPYRDRGAMLAAAIENGWAAPRDSGRSYAERAWEECNAVSLVQLYAYLPHSSPAAHGGFRAETV